MRSSFAAVLGIVLVTLCAGVSFGDDRSLQKVSEHVYAYVDAHNASPAGNSFGSNAGVVIGRDSVVVIDTLISAREGERMLADIRKITDKPVRYVVNTHYHVDHVLGNCAFTRQGAVVVAHANTLKAQPLVAVRLGQLGQLGFTPADLEGTVPVAPSLTFTDRFSIDLGDVTVELSYPGPTHTDGSIIAYIPQDKTLFTGDILFTRYHPNLGEGDLASWQKVLDALAQIDATQIIPGHGPLSSKSDLAEMKAYLQAFDAQARILCANKRAEDAAAVARELLTRLPQQNRTELEGMVQRNLAARYLPPAGR